MLSSYTHNLNIYHLFNNNFLTIFRFIEILNKLNIDIELTTLKQFQKSLEANTSNNYFGITNYIQHVSNDIILDNTYTNNILEKLNLKWPKISNEYIIKIINYLKYNKLIGDENEKL